MQESFQSEAADFQFTFEILRSSVQSYLTLCQGIQHATRFIAASSIAPHLGVSVESVRLRQSKPELWTISQIHQLAGWLGYAQATCIKVTEALEEALAVIDKAQDLSSLQLLKRYQLLWLKDRLPASTVWAWRIAHLHKLQQGLEIGAQHFKSSGPPPLY